MNDVAKRCGLKPPLYERFFFFWTFEVPVSRLNPKPHTPYKVVSVPSEAMSEPSESPSERESDLDSRSVIGLLRRGRHMAQVALGPNHHRRHRRGGDLTVPQPSRPHSSASFTSVGGQQQRPHTPLNITHLNGSQHGMDMDDDGGAEIPDIPLKRPSRQLTSEQQTLKPSRIEEAWVEEDNDDWRPHRPINPNDIPSQKDRLYVS